MENLDTSKFVENDLHSVYSNKYMQGFLNDKRKSEAGEAIHWEQSFDSLVDEMRKRVKKSDFKNDFFYKSKNSESNTPNDSRWSIPSISTSKRNSKHETHDPSNAGKRKSRNSIDFSQQYTGGRIQANQFEEGASSMGLRSPISTLILENDGPYLITKEKIGQTHLDPNIASWATELYQTHYMQHPDEPHNSHVPCAGQSNQNSKTGSAHHTFSLTIWFFVYGSLVAFVTGYIYIITTLWSAI